MSRIYTKTGDSGTTSLVGGKRVSKTDARLEAYGTVDELNSFLGLVRCSLKNGAESEENLHWIQQMLFRIGGALATDTQAMPIPESCQVTDEHVSRIEGMIDALQEGLPAQHSFILPGGCLAASYAHVARTVCRRAERQIIAIASQCTVPSALLCFMNRLSDYLFVLARCANQCEGEKEILWQ